MTVPDYIPMLCRGVSIDPRYGGCLVQVANWLADPTKWTDNPDCVHAILADRAIAINDLVDDQHRHQLAVLAPRLSGTAATVLDTEVTSGLIKWIRENPEPYKLVSGGYKEIKSHDGIQLHFQAPAQVLSSTNQQEAVDWLTALLDEYDRLTGRTPEPLPRERWDEVRELLGQK